jgi:hypothetical protein
MATCPRCRGHLTDTHRCPRHPGRVAAEIAAAGLAGGVVALLALAFVDPQGQLARMDTVAVIVGVLSGIGLDRLLRG